MSAATPEPAELFACWRCHATRFVRVVHVVKRFGVEAMQIAGEPQLWQCINCHRVYGYTDTTDADEWTHEADTDFRST
jgi:hypothetical protein